MSPPTPQTTVDYILKAYENTSAEKIAKHLNINASTVCRILKRNKIAMRNGSERTRTFEINTSYFKNIDSEEKAYFLGFLFADGSVDKSSGIKISLKSWDEDILEKFSNIIYGFKKIVNSTTNDGKTEVSTLYFYSKEMVKDLAGYGCVNAKAFLIRLPKLNDDMYRHFIRGYFDGDGCISFKKDGRTIIDITSNAKFTEDLRVFLLDKAGVKMNKYISSRNNETACIQATSRKQVVAFLNYIYKDSTIYMNRKYNKHLVCLQNDGRAPRITINENEITSGT